MVYSASGIREGAHAVGAYTLLPRKAEEAYDEFLSQIKILNHQSDPLSIMTDFEKGEINSITRAYPNAEPAVCLFHLSKNVYKPIKDEGLQ